jgi:hypothetical protein
MWVATINVMARAISCPGFVTQACESTPQPIGAPLAYPRIRDAEYAKTSSNFIINAIFVQYIVAKSIAQTGYPAPLLARLARTSATVPSSVARSNGLATNRRGSIGAPDRSPT